MSLTSVGAAFDSLRIRLVRGDQMDEAKRAFSAGLAHGIAQERLRCAKVCRDRAAVLDGIDDSHSRARREASLNCATAIESPTEAADA